VQPDEIDRLVRRRVAEAVDAIAAALMSRYMICRGDVADALWEAGRAAETAAENIRPQLRQEA
jgi:hypothetical protein